MYYSLHLTAENGIGTTIDFHSEGTNLDKILEDARVALRGAQGQPTVAPGEPGSVIER